MRLGLPPILKAIDVLRLQKEGGTGPVRALRSRPRYVNLDKLPMDGGMLPEMVLLSRASQVRPVKAPI